MSQTHGQDSPQSQKPQPSQQSQQSQQSKPPQLSKQHSFKTMYTPIRRNSVNAPTVPPSPFFDRQEFFEPSPSSPTSSINRVSKVYTDPFSDNHRASVNSADSEASQNKRVTRTPSISSIVSLSSHGTLPNFDVHVMYKIKTKNSSKKVSNFFGEQIPLDVGVKEIQRGGLGALLHSKIPLCYFLRFLLDEYTSENLFFFIEVEQYETFQYHSRTQQLATAQHIYETYLTRNSQFEVNVEDRVRKTIIMSLRDQLDLRHCFDPAKRAVFTMLEGSYNRHRLSSGWERVVQEIGENTIHYDEMARDMAVNHLLEHITRQQDTLYTNPHAEAFNTNNSRRRHELLKSMVHEFCRSMLGVDFDYYRPEPYYIKSPPVPDTRARSPLVPSNIDGFDGGEGAGAKSLSTRPPGYTHSRQPSRGLVGKKHKDKLELLFGIKGKSKGPEGSKLKV